MNQFVIFIVGFSVNLAMMIFTSQVLPNKLNAWKIIAISIVIGAISNVKTIFDMGTPVFVLIGIISFILITYGIPTLFFTGKLWRRYVVFTFFSVIIISSDALSTSIITAIYGNTDILLTEMTPLLIYSGFAFAIYILVGSVSVFVWKMIAARRFQPYYLLFFILPIGQLITLYSFMFSTWSILWFLGVFIALIADLVLLVYTISLENKTALEEELRETRHVMELEQSHYREVEQRREELARIRHDINNQLASIGQLIRMGEEVHAQEMIADLSEEIIGTKECSYCTIPVVNATLIEKTQVCMEAGIGLNMDLILPDSLAVEQIHLCSIFGNLLDNAIVSCKQLKQSEMPTIQLKTMVDGSYLFVKVINPSGEPKNKPAPGHGYGSRILSDLAARYNGDYTTEYSDGVFTAMVSLLALRD